MRCKDDNQDIFDKLEDKAKEYDTKRRQKLAEKKKRKLEEKKRKLKEKATLEVTEEQKDATANN